MSRAERLREMGTPANRAASRAIWKRHSTAFFSFRLRKAYPFPGRPNRPAIKKLIVVLELSAFTFPARGAYNSSPA